MRLSTVLQLAAATAVAIAPVAAQAAPLRAASALPARGSISATPPARAAAPSRRASDLTGLPIFVILGVIGSASLVAVVASGRGRSPG